jgi:hypothetical protein
MELLFNLGVAELRKAITDTVREFPEYCLDHTVEENIGFKIWSSSKGIYFQCTIKNSSQGCILSITALSPFSILTPDFENFWNTQFICQLEKTIAGIVTNK